MSITIDYGTTTVPVDITKVEQKYNATYICDMAIKTKAGGWTESPAQIYWQENPPHGYSNYFAIIIQGGSLYITSAKCLEDIDIAGIIVNDKVYFSRFRWDCRGEDGTFIDGGRDYTKMSGSMSTNGVVLNFVGPKLEIKPRDLNDG